MIETGGIGIGDATDAGEIEGVGGGWMMVGTEEGEIKGVRGGWMMVGTEERGLIDRGARRCGDMICLRYSRKKRKERESVKKMKV